MGLVVPFLEEVDDLKIHLPDIRALIDTCRRITGRGVVVIVCKGAGIVITGERTGIILDVQEFVVADGIIVCSRRSGILLNPDSNAILADSSRRTACAAYSHIRRAIQVTGHRIVPKQVVAAANVDAGSEVV